MLPPVDLSPIWISLQTSLVATAIATITGIAAARWMLSYRGAARGIIDGVLTLPLVLPPTVVGFGLLVILGRYSPLGQLFRQVGITIIFTWPATVIAAAVVSFPLMYKTVLAAFEQIEPDLIDAARTLGASEWRIFWLLLLPMAASGVMAGTILAFARALGEFGATLMVAGSIPGVTQTIPIAIFFATEAGRMGEALIWVVLMVAISLAVVTTIHYWGTSPSARRTVQIRSNTLTQQLFDRLIVGQLAHLSRDNVIYHYHAARPQKTRLSQGQPSLEVDLYKSVDKFVLDISFRTVTSPLGILGASGSGKSMTLRCIAGLDTPTKGRIVLNGQVMFDTQLGIDVPSRQRRVGYVFQQYALFPHLTVTQNIAFGLGHVPAAERVRRVIDQLDRMALSGLGDRYPHQLSGGQQQRVALARAIAIEPEILLLDEPLSALDTYLRSRIETLLIETLSDYSGMTLFITHKLEEAYRICPHLVVMSTGCIVADAPKAEIFERPQTVTVAQVTECKNFSRIEILDTQQIRALDWNCTLMLVEPVPPWVQYVGIRAHHLTFVNSLQLDNTVPCGLAMISETQHRVTLYLKLYDSGDYERNDVGLEYQLQAEVYKEAWESLKDRPFPWYVHLSPMRLMLLSGVPDDC